MDDVTPSTPETPGELVRRYELSAKKRFGQHFLVDPRILDQIAQAAEIGPGDRVLEVGPGPGALTLTMLQCGARVVAVELDRDLAAFLRRELVPGTLLELVEGDILAQDLGALLDEHSLADASGGEEPSVASQDVRRWKCAANLPYNVATEVFFRLSEVMERFALLALMFQREVARRFVARCGESDYGTLSLMSQLFCDAEIVMSLPPGAFRPPPKVHSAVVQFRPVPGTRIPDARLRETFRTLVRHAFQTRRKTLPNALASTGVDKSLLKEAIAQVGLDLRVRPERVDFEGFVALARALQPEFES